MPDANRTLDSLRSLFAEKQKMATKETRLLEKLNASFRQMGYQLIPISAEMPGKRRGRPLGSGNKKPMVTLNGAATEKIVKRRAGRASR